MGKFAVISIFLGLASFAWSQPSRNFLFHSQIEEGKKVTYTYEVKERDTVFYEFQDCWLSIDGGDSIFHSFNYYSADRPIVRSTELVTPKGLRLLTVTYYDSIATPIPVKLSGAYSYAFRDIDKFVLFNRQKVKMTFYTDVIWGKRSKPVKTETTKRMNLRLKRLRENRAYFEKISIFTFRWRSFRDRVSDKYYLTFEKHIGLVEYTLSEKGKVMKTGKLHEIQIQDL